MTDEQIKLTFESGDYYGPDLKLELDLSDNTSVKVTLSAEASGATASVTYGLYVAGDVERLIEGLQSWLLRHQEWLSPSRGKRP